ncbi:hypothetical protein FB451DRAFT_1173569 [Mycena latifolia]|nr:hypothetical protein FB451DRAFT_1173569 [Mycena latifolia]
MLAKHMHVQTNVLSPVEPEPTQHSVGEVAGPIECRLPGGTLAEKWARRIAHTCRAAARCRRHGSTAPVQRVPVPSRQPFFMALNGTVTARVGQLLNTLPAHFSSPIDTDSQKLGISNVSRIIRGEPMLNILIAVGDQ